MKAHVRKWGNSMGIRIPKVFALKLGLLEGSEIDMDVVDQQLILKKRNDDLASLVSKITPENVHGEVDTGSPKGHEIW